MEGRPDWLGRDEPPPFNNREELLAAAAAEAEARLSRLRDAYDLALAELKRLEDEQWTAGGFQQTMRVPLATEHVDIQPQQRIFTFEFPGPFVLRLRLLAPLVFGDKDFLRLRWRFMRAWAAHARDQFDKNVKVR